MKVNNVQNSNYNNSTSFGKLTISEKALHNILEYAPDKKRALTAIEKLEKELADTKHWDLSVAAAGVSGRHNIVGFTNKTNPKEFFYRKIKVAPVSSLPKTVHIWSHNDGFVQDPLYCLGTLRFPTFSNAIKAANSLSELSRHAEPNSVGGLKRLVYQTKILEQASEHMSKKPPTILQKIELYLRKKNEYSIFQRIARGVLDGFC